jgi:hypothetical protein
MIIVIIRLYVAVGSVRSTAFGFIANRLPTAFLVSHAPGEHVECLYVPIA